MKTGNTAELRAIIAGVGRASMEPGHEDREYAPPLVDRRRALRPVPQWSPVMKTGNTTPPGWNSRYLDVPQWSPVMKTGNTSAERSRRPPSGSPQWSPVMKTGNTRTSRQACPRAAGLNGARS